MVAAGAGVMPKRNAAILWFVASGLSLVAFVLRYIEDGEIHWPLLAATFFLGAMGFTTFRRSRGGDA
jgi:hypothetical protein